MPGVEEQENGEKASKAAYLMVKVTINTTIIISTNIKTININFVVAIVIVSSNINVITTSTVVVFTLISNITIINTATINDII